MDFITRENVVLHETIWHKLAEKNLYKMLKELRYTDEMFINYQKNRFKKCSVFLIVGVILSFIQPYLILAGIALALLQWTNEYKRVKRIYNNSLFQKQLTFSKFTRMLIPYLLQSNSTLYNVFNKMLLRLEEGYVKSSLENLIIEMNDNPNSEPRQENPYHRTPLPSPSCQVPLPRPAPSDHPERPLLRFAAY